MAKIHHRRFERTYRTAGGADMFDDAAEMDMLAVECKSNVSAQSI